MQLPEHRKNVFLYLCAFLQETLGHVTENGLDAKTVATLFGTIFLRDPPRSRAELSSRSRNNQAVTRKKANFVYHFLVNDQSDLILGREPQRHEVRLGRLKDAEREREREMFLDRQSWRELERACSQSPYLAI
uniref:Rho-GAP domain-containing protein n=1 Tax=Timema douglasi TaxID=61478 RepID=A0A7R8W0T9_TIMDO|nr:unnamed protein product [Timema douglasi]